MSKDIDWGLIHGEGEIVCTCDQCGREHRVDFEDGFPGYPEAQAEIRSMGWVSMKQDDEWLDFCGQRCRNQYIKENC